MKATKQGERQVYRFRSRGNSSRRGRTFWGSAIAAEYRKQRQSGHCFKCNAARDESVLHHMDSTLFQLHPHRPVVTILQRPSGVSGAALLYPFIQLLLEYLTLRICSTAS